MLKDDIIQEAENFKNWMLAQEPKEQVYNSFLKIYFYENLRQFFSGEYEKILNEWTLDKLEEIAGQITFPLFDMWEDFLYNEQLDVLTTADIAFFLQCYAEGYDVRVWWPADEN